MPTTQLIGDGDVAGLAGRRLEAGGVDVDGGALAAQVLGAERALRLSAGECGGGGSVAGEGGLPGGGAGGLLDGALGDLGASGDDGEGQQQEQRRGQQRQLDRRRSPLPGMQRSWRGPFHGADGGLG